MDNLISEFIMAGGAFLAYALITYVLIIVFMIVVMWTIFVKAGKPGWAAIVPVYNIIVMLEIAGKPIWWIILFFVPFVSSIIGLVILYSLVRNFGKGMGFFLGCLFLGIIFWPILAFGDAKYLGQNV